MTNNSPMPPETLQPLRPTDAPANLAEIIGRIAALMKSGAVSPGDRAALRRMRPGHAPPLTWYQFAVVSQLDRQDSSLDWITIVAGMALMSPDAHAPGRGWGEALFATGYSELRLERLLMSEGPTQRLLVLRAARFLAAHNTAANWVQPAALLLAREADKRERVCNIIATDYYRSKIN